jgi:hypothetical protein
MMRTNKPQVKKWVLPWTLLILVSVGMVGWIWREQRLAAKGGVPWGGGQDTTTPLSNHVYGIQGVIRRKLSIGDGCSTIKPTLLRGLFHHLHDG